MKFRNLALTLLLAGGISASCIKEDHSDCRNIYRLALSYFGDGQTEIFHEKIESVQMYVFDAQNNCVVSRELSKAEVEARLTTLPSLVSGEYKIVCIGNADQTEVENLSAGDLEQITFASTDYLAGRTVSGNDPLYWSSIDYTINPYDMFQLEQTKTTEFKSSHYDVVVEATGVPMSTKSTPSLSIILEGVSPQTDFLNKAKGTPTDYVLETSYNDKGDLTASCNIMRHSPNQEVYLVITGATGDEIVRVNVAEHIAEHNIDMTKQECVIPFKFEFTSADVAVTVPDWFIENVTPEF